MKAFEQLEGVCPVCNHTGPLRVNRSVLVWAANENPTPQEADLICEEDMFEMDSQPQHLACPNLLCEGRGQPPVSVLHDN